jgi:hypothetical protein
MATNKILNIQQWATAATVSNPESGYKKIYPKTGSDYWYTVDDQGYEKEIGVSLDVKNGLKLTTLSPSSIYNYQLDLALGGGLTFSGDFAGSLVSVSGLTAGSLSSVGGATAGYILSVTGSGQFNWIQSNPGAGVSGTINRIAKFNSPTSVSDSLIRDDGSNVYIGVTPSSAVGLLNVNGDFFANKYYISDDINAFINYNNGVYVQTDLGFKINNFAYNYLSFNYDNVSSYTFSVLDGLVEIGDAASKYISAINIDTVTIGRTSSGTSSVYFYSNNSNLLTLDTNGNSGALIIKDGTQGLNKLFVSDSNGKGTWQYLNAYKGVTISGLTLSSNISGYGLTLSGDSLSFDYSIFGSTLTYSTGVVNLKTSGVTAGSYGSSASIAQITVDTYGRVTNVVTYSISQGTNVFSGNGLTNSGNTFSVNIGTGLTFSAGVLQSLDLTRSGNGLTNSGNTFSVNIGTGLTFSGGVLQSLDLSRSGNGLTNSGNTFSVLLQSNSGLTVSSSGLSVSPTIAGTGLSWSSGVLSVPYLLTVTMSASFTVGTTQSGYLFDVTTSTSLITITTPTASNGFEFTVRKVDQTIGAILVNNTYEYSGSTNFSYLTRQNQTITYKYNGTNWSTYVLDEGILPPSTVLANMGTTYSYAEEFPVIDLNDTIQGAMNYNQGGWNYDWVSGTIFSAYQPLTLSNVTARSMFYTASNSFIGSTSSPLTIKSYSLKVGKSIRVLITGTASGSTSLIIYPKIGSQTFSTTAITTGSVANDPWRLEYEFKVTDVGPLGRVHGSGFWLGSSSTVYKNIMDTTASYKTIDTTIDNRIDFLLTSSDSYTIIHSTIERLA